MAAQKKHLNEEKRPERVSVADQPRAILTVLNKDPDYEYRWANGNPDRLYRLKRAGYDEVTYGDLEVGEDSINAPSDERSNSVVTRPGGQGTTLVLLRIKREWYDEDQAKKQADIDERELQMVSEAKQGRYGKFTIER